MRAVAGVNLIRQVGGVVSGAACIIELPELNGRAKLPDVSLFVLLEREDTLEAAEAAQKASV